MHESRARFVMGAVFFFTARACGSANSPTASIRLTRTAVIHASGDTLSPPCAILRLQTPGGVTAVCWHANVSPTTLQLLRFPHLSQGMFITHSSGPKISVGTTHPGCVMNPPAACLVIRRSRSKGPLPSLLPLSSASSMSFTSLCFRSLLFFFPPLTKKY